MEGGEEDAAEFDGGIFEGGGGVGCYAGVVVVLVVFVVVVGLTGDGEARMFVVDGVYAFGGGWGEGLVVEG